MADNQVLMWQTVIFGVQAVILLIQAAILVASVWAVRRQTESAEYVARVNRTNDLLIQFSEAQTGYELRFDLYLGDQAKLPSKYIEDQAFRDFSNRYLNIHEIIAFHSNNHLLDQKIVDGLIAPALHLAWEKFSPLVTYLRTSRNSGDLYSELAKSHGTLKSVRKA